MSKSGFARVFERFLSRIEAALSQAYTIPAVKNAWRIPGYRPFNLDWIFSGHMWAGKMFPHADAFKRIWFWIIRSSDSGKTQIAEETKANWREDLFLRKSTMSKSMSKMPMPMLMIGSHVNIAILWSVELGSVWEWKQTTKSEVKIVQNDKENKLPSC